MLKWVKKPEENNLTSLDRIRILPNEAQAAAKNNPGDLSELEWYEANKHLLDLTSRSNNIRARKIFAWAIFAMVGVWLTAVLTIVVLTGLKKFDLDKTVLIALITSGSVNVIGLFSLVAKYLFHVHETHEPVVEQKIGNVAESQPSGKFATEPSNSEKTKDSEKEEP